jgi:hypothetical protein
VEAGPLNYAVSSDSIFSVILSAAKNPIELSHLRRAA